MLNIDMTKSIKERLHKTDNRWK